MKAKLIKIDGQYKLFRVIGNDGTMLSLNEKLSIKNCQAIERGYDLDELAFTSIKGYDNPIYISAAFIHFKEGFQKALEILGDKNEKLLKSLKDLESGLNSFKHHVTASYLHLDCENIIQSLQQTEWDVEIEMECGELKQCECSSNENCLDPQPKLDADGCLILKRI